MVVSGSPDERIAAVAGAQRGRISRDQLRAIDLTDAGIHRRVRSGCLIREFRAVYAVGHAAPAPLAAETAALLACGDRALLSHRTAGQLWQLIPERLNSEGDIHITVPDRHAARPPGVKLHRTDSLTPADIGVVVGLPVTSPARALLDMADDLDQPALNRAVEEALLQRLVTLPQLDRLAAGATGRRGAGRLRIAVALHHGPGITRSEAERRFRGLIQAADLPEPRSNVRLHGHEVDFHWPEHRLVVEIDGYRYHSSRPAFERDSAKGAKLVALGLQFMRFTWLQMEHQPLVVVARVTQALTRGLAA